MARQGLGSSYRALLYLSRCPQVQTRSVDVSIGLADGVGSAEKQLSAAQVQNKLATPMRALRTAVSSLLLGAVVAAVPQLTAGEVELRGFGSSCTRQVCCLQLAPGSPPSSSYS